ncbi:MAG: hypothetical protein OXJ37_10935 [Bryobacterales bacterium]|nr:hypothetical protein [Bryobacterales bacterium]
MDQLHRFRRAIARALGSRSDITVARSAGLPRLAIRQALNSSEPKLNRAAAIAEAVGLEIHIGPPAERASDVAARTGLDARLDLDGARDQLRTASECLKRVSAALDDLDGK